MRSNLLYLVAAVTLGLAGWWAVAERSARIPRAGIDDRLPRTSHVTVRSGASGEPLETDQGVAVTLTEDGIGVAITLNQRPLVSEHAPGAVRLAGAGVAFLEGPTAAGSVIDERSLPMTGGGFVPPGETLYWHSRSFEFEELGADAFAVASLALFYDLEFEIDGASASRPDSTMRLYLPLPRASVDGLFELKPWER